MKNRMSSMLCWICVGVGGTLLYQQLKNGNLKSMVREMNRAKTKMIDDLEDMM